MSTFTLKCIALVLMVIDHIGFYFFETIPIWFRWIGRASYPLFLFCMVWGYHYTRDRKKYLLRLYLASVFMVVFRYVSNLFFAVRYEYGEHNIFLTLFWVGVLISAIELFQKDWKNGALLLGILFGVQLIYYILPPLLPFVKDLDGSLISGVIPNLAVCEYGFSFVALGVLMYFLKEKKELFCVMYILFCIYQFSNDMLNGEPYQCFMILALPLILRYNQQKGYGMKWFFYLFYPAHTFLLFYLLNVL